MILQELTERLTLQSGLMIVTEQSTAAQGETLVRLQVNSLTFYLVWKESVQPDALVLRLLEALAQEIFQELISKREKIRAQTMGTWEWLLSEANQYQWDSVEFAHQAEQYHLPPLDRGFPVYIHCSPWHPEIPEVAANLYPHAQLRWFHEPDFFLWLPVGNSQVSRQELKAQGEALIQEVYSLFADELGVTTTVFVGEPLGQNAWEGFLEVKQLSAVHQRFFAGEPGLMSWKLGLAALFTSLEVSSAHEYGQRMLGSLSKELLDTLVEFLEHDLSIGDASKALYIHRNTLIYRLDRITELTGYNPRRLKNAVHFYIAIWLRKHMKA